MDLYRAAMRPLLFRFDPERTHRATMAACARLGRHPLALRALTRAWAARDPHLRTTVAGITLPSPIGLAGGFDKNGEAIAVLARLGFGCIEIGSVSEHPSAGNAPPRLWRLPADEALRVHYGCPNDGAAAVAARLRATARPPVPLGVNVVETNTGAVAGLDDACEEIAAAARRFIGLADYLVLNLSCPNMPQGGCGLFDTPAALRALLQACDGGSLPPVFLKLTPPGDATDPRIIDPILQTVDPFGFVRGFILNIPNRRPVATLRTPAAVLEGTRGGITGPSLRAPTAAATAAWYRRIDRRRHALVAAGGIGSAEEAYAMIRLGASLVQIYTALVYRGPGLIGRINRGLVRLLARDGLHGVADAVGLDNPAPTASPPLTGERHAVHEAGSAA